MAARVHLVRTHGIRCDDILWHRDDGTISMWDNGQVEGAHWIADPGQVANSWHIV
jgi:hypothetical protein